MEIVPAPNLADFPSSHLQAQKQTLPSSKTIELRFSYKIQISFMTLSPDLRRATGAASHSAGAERDRITRLASFLLVYKLAFFAGIWGLVRLIPDEFSVASFEHRSVGASAPSPGLWRYFETWDAHHYLHLARYGYGDQPMSLAFYPSWPFLVRLAAPLFGGNFTLAALVLSNAFSIAALVMLHRLVARRFDENIANQTLLLMLAFPGAIFLCLPYTESLFLLLCVALFWLLERAAIRLNIKAPNNQTTTSWRANDGRLVLGVGMCAAGAAFARPNGLFLIFPLAYFAWQQRQNAVWRWVALAPIVGIVGYFATIYAATGDVTAGLKAQQLFAAQPTATKLFDVPNFVRVFFDTDPEHGFVHDRILFVLFCATLWPLWKRDKLWFCFAIVMGLTTAFSASLTSFTRYLSMIFPCFVMAAVCLNELRSRIILPFLLLVLYLLQTYFLLLHINYYWFS